MAQDQDPVLSEAQIQLHPVGTGGEGRLDGGESVLRTVRADQPAMRDDKHGMQTAVPG